MRKLALWLVKYLVGKYSIKEKELFYHPTPQQRVVSRVMTLRNEKLIDTREISALRSADEAFRFAKSRLVQDLMNELTPLIVVKSSQPERNVIKLECELNIVKPNEASS